MPVKVAGAVGSIEKERGSLKISPINNKIEAENEIVVAPAIAKERSSYSLLKTPSSSLNWYWSSRTKEYKTSKRDENVMTAVSRPIR